jgi:hypothetical protein
MLEKTTRILSENLARTLDRRQFLKRAGTTAFGGLAALAAGHATTALAVAGVRRQPADRSESADPPLGIRCAPPGPYCNTGGGALSGCHGSSCFQHMVGSTVHQCRVYYSFYQAGCWTTPEGGGYWTCCDCECGTPRVASCGCAQFSTTPQPRPDGPVSGAE